MTKLKPLPAVSLHCNESSN